MSGNKVVLTFAGDTKDLEKATGKVDAQTKKMGGSFDKLALVGAAAGVAAGAALAMGIAGGMEREQVGNTLAAQLGGTPEMAGKLGSIAGDLYTQNFGDSVADVGEALRSVLASGLDAASVDGSVDKIAAKVITTAKLMGASYDQVSNAAMQMVRNGLAKSSDEAVDVLVTGLQMGVDKSQDLLDTFNEYGTQFRKLGLDGPAALGLMSQAIQAGARDSDTAADALKEFSIRAIDGSTLTAGAFKMLGLDGKAMAQQIAAGGPTAAAGLNTVLTKLRDMKDPVAQAAAATGLFGTKAEDLGGALFAMDLGTATDGMDNVAGAADRAAEVLGGGAAASLETFKRKAQDALVDQLAKALPYIESTLGWLQKNSDWVVPLATGLGILAGVVWLVTAATAAWNAVMLVSPVTWIVLGIVALIAVIVLIATKTTWFQDAWNWAWGGIKSAASNVWDWLKGLPDKIGNAFSAIAGFITAPFRTAFNFISDAWNGTIGKLSWTVPGWVPFVGGNTISAPKLPKFHSGGVVPGAPGSEMLAVLQAGERVTPAGAGGGRTVLELRSSGSRIDDMLLEILAEAIGKRGGNVQLVVGR